jgi:VanZ family protein
MKRVNVIALALIAILLAAVVFAPVPGDSRWIRTLHNSAHAPIFGCVSLLVLLVTRSHPRLQTLGLLAQYILALAAAFALGVITELLQIPAGRDASVEDALHDTIGALALLGLFATVDTRVRGVPQNIPIRFAAAVVGLVSLGIAAAPVTRAAIKYQQRDERFPVLADFSQRYDRYFILQQSSEFSPVTLPTLWARTKDESAMRFTTSGMTISPRIASAGASSCRPALERSCACGWRTSRRLQSRDDSICDRSRA